MNREKAYKIVQRNAHLAWNQEGGNFKANLESDKEISENLTSNQLQNCFNTDIHQSNLDVIWERLGI